MLTNVEIEQKELKYLKKFYHFLKSPIVKSSATNCSSD